jgi:tRNA(Ile)-lysidine synthase
VARGSRTAVAEFGPQSLGRQLRQLLPDFPDVRLCVAFSGGADSTALLAALAQLKRPPLRLRALHVDHGLHPHSRRWSAHCRRVARALAVPLAVRRVRIERRGGESPEAAARAARYRVLAAELEPGEALLTAHHQDDQLETVLLQMLRGAGLAGLAAMPAKACWAGGTLLRPLLSWPGESLRGWLRAQGLSWIEDPSNAELHLDRNYLRAQVLPALRARWPAAGATVARTAQHAAQAQRLLDVLGCADAARASYGARLSAAQLRALPPERCRNALRYWISAAGHLAPPAKRLEEIAGALLQARPDARPFVAWQGVMVQREADLLSLCAVAPLRAAGALPAPPPADIRWPWRRRRRCAVPQAGGTLTLRSDAHGPVDLERLPATLTIRARRGGERLRPLPGGPRRALKSLLQEARVPLAVRARVPLVFAADTLIAVAGLWLDASVQAGAASRHRARLIWSAAG